MRRPPGRPPHRTGWPAAAKKTGGDRGRGKNFMHYLKFSLAFLQTLYKNTATCASIQ